ncbi:hypothetical protein EV356DRAFT_452466 [Viridothelium virens]|uniref:Pantetheine-phosphate adenylyltransferase family protein-like protein n=1 Tax=Viridothelium virens TaxID=1048519 RepID=A0A6A6H0B2_VIRVR|nr:hypothetical protein EV356DRAFT_452466 [Viridothelium virens]
MTSSEDAPPSALLLLPPPPSSPTFTTLNAAYGPALKTALQESQTRSSSTKRAIILDVAIPSGHVFTQQREPRCALYGPLQALVSGLYKLVCFIGSQNEINLEDADGVDVRVIPLNYPTRYSTVGLESKSEDFEGPLINIQRLALSSRSWETLFAVESEEGLRFCKDFLEVEDTSIKVQHVQGGIVQHASHDRFNQHEGADAKAHYSVAVGGTFDHLHIGHKLLLTMTALACEPPGSSSPRQERTLTVGITGDALLKNKKHAEYLGTWNTREKVITSFLLGILDFCPKRHSLREKFITTTYKSVPGPNGHVVSTRLASGITINCTEIQDPYGPTITDPDISALVVSAETRAGGQAVNTKRAEKGWAGLQVLEVDVLDTEDDEGSRSLEEKEADSFRTKISSTEIRRLLAEKAQKATQ